MVKKIKVADLPEFDMAEQLRNEEDIAEYLSMVMADGDTDELIRAIGYVAKGRGMTEIAKVSGLGRESLYKTFRPGAKPQFDTVMKVLKAINVDLKAVTHVNHNTAH
ncbi:MAG: addiction module antidote protein [Spongiibacteraceae bacterium]